MHQAHPLLGMRLSHTIHVESSRGYSLHTNTCTAITVTKLAWARATELPYFWVDMYFSTAKQLMATISSICNLLVPLSVISAVDNSCLNTCGCPAFSNLRD